jgi:hypothetical protein
MRLVLLIALNVVLVSASCENSLDAAILFRIHEKESLDTMKLSWEPSTTPIAKDKTGGCDCVKFPGDIPTPSKDYKWSNEFYKEYVDWLKQSTSIYTGDTTQEGYETMHFMYDSKDFYCGIKEDLNCVSVREIFQAQCLIKYFV